MVKTMIHLIFEVFNFQNKKIVLYNFNIFKERPLRPAFNGLLLMLFAYYYVLLILPMYGESL